MVNAMPIGVAAYPAVPIPVALPRSDLRVSDVIYDPAETELLTGVRRLGARTGNGKLFSQAVAQVWPFTGIEADAREFHTVAGGSLITWRDRIPHHHAITGSLPTKKDNSVWSSDGERLLRREGFSRCQISPRSV
jgi:hypothetical protein